MMDTFWRNYLRLYEINASDRRRALPQVCAGAHRLKEDEEENQRLLSGVLDREVTGTVCPLSAWTALNRPIPKAGECRILLDNEDNPRCIIRTGQVHLVPWCNMTEEYATLEKQDDSLWLWQQRVRPALLDICRKEGRPFSVDTLLLVETFEMVYFEEAPRP